jgi:hypothetical protein
MTDSSTSPTAWAISQTISGERLHQVGRGATAWAKEDRLGSSDWRYNRIDQSNPGPRRSIGIVTDNISLEQAVDEAIARIKQILVE